ncbi:MAG: nucleoside hydrolase [Eubacteriales bacterium]
MQPFEGAREGKILLGGETDGFAADNERDFRGGDSAVEFLLETVKKYPNEIVLVGIGPLTNIARAILKDRAAMEKVKKIIIMGGNYFHSKLEWNILSDSAAAKIVFESGLPLFCVGTDVTEKVKLNNARQKILFSAEDPVGRRIARYAAEWIEKRGADITCTIRSRCTRRSAPTSCTLRNSAFSSSAGINLQTDILSTSA